MTLPASGQLSLKDIGVELSITAGNQASLRSMSSTAGFSTPDAVSEFYGYSAGDNILVSYGSITNSSTSTVYYDYRTINLDGLSTGSIKPYLYTTSGGWSSVNYVYWQWSLNSTSSWTTFRNYTSQYQTGYDYIPSSYVTAGNVLRIRIYISHSVTWSITTAYGDIQAVYDGTGISSYTRTGTYVWTVNAS